MEIKLTLRQEQRRNDEKAMILEWKRTIVDLAIQQKRNRNFINMVQYKKFDTPTLKMIYRALQHDPKTKIRDFNSAEQLKLSTT